MKTRLSVTTGSKRRNAGKVTHPRKPSAADGKEKIALLEQKMNEALEQQTATADVLKVISRSTFDLQAVLDTLTESAARLCQAENVQIFLRNGEVYSLAAHNGFSPEYQDYVKRHPQTPGRGSLVARTALEVAAVHIPDVLSDPEYSFLEGQRLGGFRAMLGVPLLRDGSCIGVMVMTRATPRPFTAKQTELVTTFADQAVIAIENVRLFDEVQARTRDVTESLQQQTATSDVLRIISRSTFDAKPDLEPLFETLLESAIRLCGATRGHVYQYDGEFLRYAASSGAAPGFREYLQENPVRSGRGSMAGRAALDLRVCHVHDILLEADYERHELIRHQPFRSGLAVPMLRDGALLGVIVILKSEVAPFTDKQIELVSTFADQAVIAIENVRLFEEVQKRTQDLSESLEQQTATGEILASISGSMTDTKPVFDTIVRNLLRLFGTRFAVVQLLYDGIIHVPAVDGAPGFERLMEHYPRPLDDSTGGGLAMLTKQTIQFSPVLGNLKAPPSTQQFARDFGFNAVIFTPMMRDDTVIGVLGVAHHEPRVFDDKQIALIKSFADQAVIAIENARLFDEVQKRTEDLRESLQQQTATADVLKVISRSTFDLQTVLQTLVQSAAQLCEADMVSVTRPRDAGNVHYHVASFGFSPEWFEHMQTHPLVPERGTLIGRVLLEGRTIHIPDVLADPEYTAIKVQQLGGFRAMLGVPLLREGSAIGVFMIARGTPQPFTDKQIELISTFADQAVIAIENVRLFDEVQARTRELARSVEELQALGEVSQAVNSTLELETVLTTIVGRAVQLSRTDAGAIYVLDMERKEFRLHATHGMSETMIAAITDQQIGLEDTNIGAATTQRKPIQVSDIRNEPTSLVNEIILREGYRGILIIPLLRPDHIVGALVVRRKAPGEFPQSTIDLLQTFADQSVVAIQNARLFENVETRTRELASSLNDLQTAQVRLVQTEKLASLGQLTAGIAHEIKNPLNFVNNFSAVSIELIGELREALKDALLDKKLRTEIGEIADMLQGNLDKVVQHGKRADSIVKNMLLHSRQGSGEHRPVDINAVVEESLNLAYHGARAEKQGFNITLERSLDPTAGEVDLFPQEITRVLLNLISNGFYATTKRKAELSGGNYEPTLAAATKNLGDSVEIRIRDNGIGIPPEVKQRMFNPFFTTKPAGEGTGLGLSLSYDIIIKQHGGSIEVDTQPGEFTEFTIVLPRAGVTIAKSGERP